MVTFMLHHNGMQPPRLTMDRAAVTILSRIGDVREAGHRRPQPRDGEAALPAEALIGTGLGEKLRIDHGLWRQPRLALLRAPLRRQVKDEKAKRNMHLRRGEANPTGIEHGLDHIVDEPLHLGRGGVFHRLGTAEEDRVAHAGNLEYGQWQLRDGRKGKRLDGRREHGIGRACPGAERVFRPSLIIAIPSDGAGGPVQVLVRDNNVDQALKALKKKMQREGIFREMKLRRHFEKPSERRAREAAEAVRRARKMERKRLEREGF